MDLRAGIAHGDALGQRGDRSHDGEGAGGAIDAVGGHAAPLLVGEIGEVERGMEAIVPRPDRPRRVELERGVGTQPSGGRVEPKLRDEVRAQADVQHVRHVVPPNLRLFAEKLLPAVQAMPTPINPASLGQPRS
jgi:hypothetical protein